MNYSLKWLFGAVTVTAFLLWLVLTLYQGLTHVEFGENQPSVPWLPKSATNVSYFKSYSFTAYEFEISEADFVKWSGWKLAPIEKSVSIPRYCYFTMKVPQLGPNPTEKELRLEMEAYQSKTAWVGNGLCYTYPQRNGGGSIVAYDRYLGKAFFWSAPR